MDKNAILQRTEIGCETILTKAVKLTQSERLVLIIVDGVSSVEELRKKVWAITEARFLRALRTLIEKGLIFEVLMPVPGQERETLDQEVMDRFLQQDPLDPVTIIAFDPEDEYGSDMAEALGFKRTSAATPAPEPKQIAWPTLSAEAATGAEAMEARALPKSDRPASGSLEKATPSTLPLSSTVPPFENGAKRLSASANPETSHGQAALHPMPDRKSAPQAAAKAGIQKREHMPSVTTAHALASSASTPRTQAVPVSNPSRPKNPDAGHLPLQRKEDGMRKKASNLEHSFPDNWPENLFEKESRVSTQRQSFRRSGLRAGTIVISIGVCAGVFELAFQVTRALLQGRWPPFL